jgi:hypothetical protein
MMSEDGATTIKSQLVIDDMERDLELESGSEEEEDDTENSVKNVEQARLIV